MDHTTNAEPDAHDYTRWRKFRIPDGYWIAYGMACDALGTNRTESLMGHIRQLVNRHGSEEALNLLAEAEQELAVRRSRKGGRPRT